MTAQILGSVCLSAKRFRYALMSMRTRFGDREWFVLDAEDECPEDGGPQVVMQGTLRQCRHWLADRGAHPNTNERNRICRLAECDHCGSEEGTDRDCMWCAA